MNNTRKRTVKSELAFIWKDNTVTYWNEDGHIVTKPRQDVIIIKENGHEV
jgi:hypothetical protein